jgi:hypothetical protein
LALLDPGPGSSALCTYIYKVTVDTSQSLKQNGIHRTGNTLMTVINLATEFKGAAKNKYMLWYDYAVIKLNHLYESIDHIGLIQK